MRTTRLFALAAGTAVLAWSVATAVPASLQAHTLTIDAAASRVTIHVGKSGLFSVAGHTHVVEGPVKGRVTLDRDHLEKSAVRLEIDAALLKVSPKGEPPGDVPKVQEAMEGKVLELARFPTILFESASISVGTRRGTAIEAVVNGRLTLHGVTRAVRVPVTGTLAGDELKVRGQVTVKQTDYGMTPVSVGGLVKVKDEVTIDLSIAAR